MAWTPPASDRMVSGGWKPPPTDQLAGSSTEWTDQSKLPSMSAMEVGSIPGGRGSVQAPTAAGGGWHQNWLQSGLGRLAAPLEVPIGMAQGAANTIIGNVYGIGKEVATGNFGRGLAERTSNAYQQAHAYQPQTPQGQQLLQTAGTALDKSGIMGLGPNMDAFGQMTHGASVDIPTAQRVAGNVADRAAPIVKPIGSAIMTPARVVSKAGHYLFNPEASAGAKGARAMTRELQSIVPDAERKPLEGAPMPDLQGPLAQSKMQVNADLRNALGAKANVVDAQRASAGEDINKALAAAPQGKLSESDPLFKQLGNLKTELVKQQGRAGTTISHNAFQTIINDVERIRNDSDTPLSSLVELRRQLSQKAKFGAPVQGFDAIGTQNAAHLSTRLNSILDTHIPGYSAARAKYGDVLGQQEPFGAAFFKDLGADETGGGDMSARILASPENLAKAKMAMGGDTEALDKMLARRVQADIAGKSARDIAQYIQERQPVLKDLPQSSKVALNAQSAQEAREALKAVRAQADKNYAANMTKFTQSTELQAKYAGEFSKLNETPAAKLPTALRATLQSMYNDKIIDLDQYTSALKRVRSMEKSINIQRGVRTFSGAATATSFAQYALHRKMWNIIVGATR